MPSGRRAGGAGLSRGRFSRTATYEASPNIALIKYWGMRDESRGLPFNSSLSMTLSRLRTRTTVRFDPLLAADRLTLNGRPASASALASVGSFLDRVRARAHLVLYADVRSRNNFPTASGLASSASGFAALAGASARAAGLALSPDELSELARYGSGSACRSVFGGFVQWEAGIRPDGRDCRAGPILPPRHWPELVDLVAVVADAPEKSTRSALAMQRSVATSPSFAARQRSLPARMRAMRRALARRDTARFFPLLIEECDEFRRVCEETDPPLDYLTPTSRAILARVRELNRAAGAPLAGYTHDAGAHIHLFSLRGDLPALRRALRGVRGIRRYWTVSAGPGGRYLERPVR